ncbi:MAG: hypothetical protein IJV15_13775 [Lachnospiraceae bacterium]|nr:hypothetical protein [Lachnospiraceae bacterium]
MKGLDNFKDILQNRINFIKQDSINSIIYAKEKSNKKHTTIFKNNLEEWLTFLCIDSPEYIAMLINHNPYFKTLYSDIYEMCLNTERLMQMYSKELAELDHNTIIYMIDEIKAEADRYKEDADKNKAEADRLKEENEKLKKQIETLISSNQKKG